MKESLQNKAIEKKEFNAWISKEYRSLINGFYQEYDQVLDEYNFYLLFEQYVLKLYTQDDECQSKIEK